MPTYLYRCICGQRRTARHGMKESPVIVCVCGKVMRKVITAPHINWNGNPPSGPDMSPQIKGLLDTTPQRREQYQAKLEERARNKVRAE